MESFDYHRLPSSQFPKGTYMVVHHGKVPDNGLVLSDVKLIHAWPNPILEASRKDAPAHWLAAIDKMSLDSQQRPQFNMGLYQVKGRNYPAAVYGPFETAHPLQLIRLQENILSLPEDMKHLAHLF